MHADLHEVYAVLISMIMLALPGLSAYGNVGTCTNCKCGMCTYMEWVTAL